MALIKNILLFYISILSMCSEAFFLNAKDIRKFFGIPPSFYEIYRNEASQNYANSDNGERKQYDKFKKYENNINEKLSSEDYHYNSRSPTENSFEYDRDYSNREENVRPHYNNDNRNCYHRHNGKDKTKDSQDTHGSRIQPIQPQFQGAVNKVQINKNYENNKEYVTGVDGKKKDYISGVLVALPNIDVNVRELLNKKNYSKNNNKYYIKPFDHPPSPEYDEELENIFFR